MAEQRTWPWASQIVLPSVHSESDLYVLCKRSLDILLAVLSIVFLAPLFVLIALLIRLDSPGPVFFTQERVGAKRQRIGYHTIWIAQNFRMYKFRSMVANADPAAHEAYIRDFVAGRVEATQESGGKFKLTKDTRVTRVGHLLRMFSLDELPQLFNVLRGEMSLVGPRPVPPYEVACYRDGDRRRLAALPGITGLWQVQGRCQVPFEEMVRMDVTYIQNASLLLDLKLLFLTIPAVLQRRGAE